MLRIDWISYKWNMCLLPASLKYQPAANASLRYQPSLVSTLSAALNKPYLGNCLEHSVDSSASQSFQLLIFKSS